MPTTGIAVPCLRSRFQQQDKISSQAIGKFSTDFIPDTVVTAATTSAFRYELIDALAESQDYIIFLMKKRYAQPLDKRTLTGGTVEECKRFLEEKTGKTFRRVK